VCALIVDVDASKQQAVISSAPFVSWREQEQDNG
jgi:hypothetical protein